MRQDLYSDGIAKKVSLMVAPGDDLFGQFDKHEELLVLNDVIIKGKPGFENL